jgi:hypothetical protein
MDSYNDCNLNMVNVLNKNLVSVCGLYCGSCGIYLATQENDTQRILEYALVLNQSYDETVCEGCRGDKKSAHCLKMCSFIDCSKERKVSHCGECEKFPCINLVEFQSKMPHRIEIIKWLAELKEVGTKQWLIEMRNRFTCGNCETVNSGYDISCRKCKITPSCAFTSQYMKMIEQYLAK